MLNLARGRVHLLAPFLFNGEFEELNLLNHLSPFLIKEENYSMNKVTTSKYYCINQFSLSTHASSLLFKVSGLFRFCQISVLYVDVLICFQKNALKKVGNCSLYNKSFLFCLHCILLFCTSRVKVRVASLKLAARFLKGPLIKKKLFPLLLAPYA